MAITQWLVPIPPDDRLLAVVSTLSAFFGERASHDGTALPAEIGALLDEYDAGLHDHSGAIDLGPDGIEVSELLTAGRPFDPRELLWTERADSYRMDGDVILYVPPAELARTTTMLADVDADGLRQVAFDLEHPRERREDLVDLAMEVVGMLRRAVDDGAGLLSDFSA